MDRAMGRVGAYRYVLETYLKCVRVWLAGQREPSTGLQQRFQPLISNHKPWVEEDHSAEGVRNSFRRISTSKPAAKGSRGCCGTRCMSKSIRSCPVSLVRHLSICSKLNGRGIECGQIAARRKGK